jgi:pimeloyl-ACP methyl ester carboxylesterase
MLSGLSSHASFTMLVDAGVRDPQTLRRPDSRFQDIAPPGALAVRCHYVENGTASGASDTPDLLLLHGFTFNAFTWSPVMAGLGRNRRVVAYDRIPFGLSDKPLPMQWKPGQDPYTADATLMQMRALIQALGLRRPVLVGNSAGALLAAQAVLDDPAAYAGLVLVCPALLSGPWRLPRWLANSPPMNRIGPLIARKVGRNDWLLRRSFHDPTRISDEDVACAGIATRIANWDTALWEYVKSANSQPRLATVLHRISVPTLIIGGAHDRVVSPADCPRIAELIPDAELSIIANAGHLPQLECPAEFQAIVNDWLARRFPV